MSLISTLGKAAAATLLAASMMASTAIPAAAQEYTKDNPLKVALVLHGTLGDKSFFDSAKAGMDKASAELPVEIKIIEAGYDRSKWQPALADATDSGYNVIIAGTFDMTGYIAELAPQYPDVKFIDFDDAPDFSTGSFPNVLGVMYGTSTAGYLAGYAAGKLTKSGKLGTILGMGTIIIMVAGFGIQLMTALRSPSSSTVFGAILLVSIPLTLAWVINRSLRQRSTA